jgi:hypothetical protein
LRRNEGLLHYEAPAERRAAVRRSRPLDFEAEHLGGRTWKEADGRADSGAYRRRRKSDENGGVRLCRNLTRKQKDRRGHHA